MSSQDLDAFKYVEGGCHLPEDRFMRNRIMTADQVMAFRNEFNNKGIYLSAYWYDNIDVKEANLYGHFYMDFDSEEDFEKARTDACNTVHYLTWRSFCNIPQRFIRVFFSGKKGIHVVVPAVVFGIEPSKDLNHHYRMMAEQILIKSAEYSKEEDLKTTDFKIYDRRRLFRVPNSIHQGTGLYKVPLTIDELKTATYEEILAKAREPAQPTWELAHEIVRARQFYYECIEKWKNRYEKKFNKDRVQKTLDFEPKCVTDLLQSGPQKGQRNNTAAALVSYFKRRGKSEQETWEAIVEWNNGSMEDRELKSVVSSVYNGDYEYGCSTLEKLSTCYADCKMRGKGY
jgi:hypothetical protein